MAMYEKTNEIKVLRDPIHGYIHVEDQVIWDCINAREFQRLHRIHQLGGDFQVYHTAEHSRFSHSLGVYEIARRMIYEVKSLNEALDEDEKIQVMCAALLHDLGHGPFSHFFESITHVSHETMTQRLILDPGTEIHQALVKAKKDLPQKVASIIAHTHPRLLLTQIISSQLDADRMDFLLRDAYETGTSYGTFDLERVLRTLRVCEDKLCVKESGVHSIEDYIMARYHMYWQVYLHPDAKSYELLIHMFFKQYMNIHTQIRPIPIFECLCQSELSTEDFLLMDEYRMMVGFQEALRSKDPLLKDFASRILDRHLFDWIEDPTEEQESEVKERIQQRNLDLNYYFYEETSRYQAYLPYQEREEGQMIWILTSKKELLPLSQCSEIVKALLKMPNKTKKRIYFAKEIGR